MPGVFISYRREDSAGHAGRLFDRLRTEFGRDRVFMDIAGIEAGVDFVDTLERAVASCDALLTVIGPDWLTCTDGADHRRLDDPADFTRIEIAAALERKIRVIPVLVAGASMPAAAALPEDLKPLARRQAAEVRDSRWEADTGSLILVLKRILASADSLRLQAAGSKEDSPTPVDRQAPVEQIVEPPQRSWARAAAMLAILAAAGAFGVVAAPSIRDYLAAKPPVAAGDALGQGAAIGTAPVEKPQPPPSTVGNAPAASTPNPTPAPPRIRVPDVRGYTRTNAAETLRSEGFIVTTEAGPSAPGVKALEVTAQTPAAGTFAAPGSRVSLVYARPDRVLPALVGRTLDDARTQIRALGFSLGSIVGDPSSSAPARQIVRQSPGAGAQLEPGTRIDLVYADPPPPIIVPNVLGSDMRSAVSLLEQAGLTITSRLPVARADLPSEQIVNQEPAAGVRVRKGTGVALLYAARPKIPAAPDVIGKPTRDAIMQLRQAGFAYRLTFEEGDRPPGMVIAQSTATRLPNDQLPTVELRITAEPAYQVALLVYHHSDDQATAQSLSTYLRSFSIQYGGVFATKSAPNYVGSVAYSSEQFEELARDIASRSAEWLSNEYGRRVELSTRLVRNTSGRHSIAIWLPARR